MGKQIIKQPDGKYAVWGSISDTFVIYNATKEEVLKFFRDDYMKKVERQMRDIKMTFKDLEDGEEPYFQFTLSFEECMELMKMNNPEIYEEIESEINKE